MKADANISVFIVLIFLAQFIITPISSQNLIPNASFEDGNCPMGFTQSPSEFRVSGWLMPDGGTPDYYHRCAKRGAGIPVNWSGFRQPASGNAFIGIYLKKGIYHENIGIKLKEPLKKGIKYYGRFSLAAVANAEYFPCEISFSFSANPLQIDLKESFDFREVTIPFPKYDQYMDFSWQIVEFTFIASGDEQYVYVGSLFSGATLCTKNKYRIKTEPMLENAAYVYLDDLYLGENEYYEKTNSFELAEEIPPVQIFFNFDEDFLLNKSVVILDSLINSLNPNYHLLITGGTDSLGSYGYNQSLGLRRAESVWRYLTFEGVDPEKVGIKSIGESNPKYPNRSEETRSFNRSALIEFYKEKTPADN